MAGWDRSFCTAAVELTQYTSYCSAGVKLTQWTSSCVYTDAVKLTQWTTYMTTKRVIGLVILVHVVVIYTVSEIIHVAYCTASV